MSPASTRVYWVCGGEILTGVGPFRLGASGGASALGCRAISLQRATELWVFYSLKARETSGPAARRHCKDCADELQAAIAEVAAWRRAA